MAIPLSAEDVKALEQTRQRLFLLSTSLTSLQRNIFTADPLLSWTSLQQSAQILASNLSSISKHLSTHDALFSSLAAFPLPSYPGRTQEHILTMLLRKKLEPGVEDWIAEGKQRSVDAGLGREDGGREDDLRQMWSWAGKAANQEARKHDWGGEYTLAEREAGVENVVTGLKGEESEEGSEEEEEEDGDGKAEDKMPKAKVAAKEANAGVDADEKLRQFNHMLRFTVTGNRPGG